MPTTVHAAGGQAGSTSGAETTVATIGKNANEELRVSLVEYHGYQLVNLRVFYVDKQGELKPGKQGLALRIGKLTELRDALTAAIGTAKTRGMI